MMDEPDDDGKRLPSMRAMENEPWFAGQDPKWQRAVRAEARKERRAATREALKEQVFALLWSRHGTGDDHDEAIAWRWFQLWPTVNACLDPIWPDRRPRTSAEVFESVERLLELHGDG